MSFSRHDRALAFSKDGSLPRNVRHLSYNSLVPVYETIQCIGYIHLVAKFLNQLLCAPQIMARDSRVQVMDSLELKATMEEVEPLGAIDVHGSSQHLLRE